MATKLDHCKILPSSPNHNAQELTLPLTHFDIPFLQSDPDQTLIFFDFQCSEPQFLDTILPGLKNSLSATLTHFLPLAGNILLPAGNSSMPVIRYLSGDSVSLTVARSDQNLSYLTANHPRAADEFYPCVPHLPPVTSSSAAAVFPAVALQITLFPQQGICIGVAYYHAAGDASSIVNFIKSWAFVNKFGEEFYLKYGELVPVLDRTLVQDPDRLDSKAWNLVKDSRVLPVEMESTALPTNKVRSTFLLTQNQVRNLKNYVFANNPNLDRVSSFVVITAHVWRCLVESDGGGGGGSDEAVFFMLAVDCRGRLRPPLPAAYFGNCVVAAVAESRRGLLLEGKLGFLAAVESLAGAIGRVLHGEGGIVESAKWPLDFADFGGKYVVAVAGSPRFDLYEADFGWGRPRKCEYVHLDRERSISVAKSREFEGGFEIGLSRGEAEMEVFESAFHRGLEEILKM
ncbi:phenolic glucoside malonyltransferase 1-like [Salvia miltiorrhiza]|uniref:phenolic glucoside malonyltransferase 1-like n=1 Tax=Salvia miltiorrhiza TaxID=226208 RepID=UPI0025AD4363|nr:phenolic glucoside malonyltransferase 1-like [Salvia miltiorrhiza]